VTADSITNAAISARGNSWYDS